MSQAPLQYQDPNFNPGAAGGGSSKAFGPTAALGGISDLVGLFSGIGQQNAQAQAITQTGQQLQNQIGILNQEGGQAWNTYQNNALPALNTIIGNAPAQAAAYQGSAAGAYGAEAGYGGLLGASPYPGMIGASAGNYTALPAASIADQMANASMLSKWQGIGPKELGQATTVASNAASSAANTMRQSLGGTPNAALAAQSLENTAATTGEQTALGLGAQAEQAELQARMAAGQEYGQVAGEQLAQAQGITGAYTAAGQAYQGAMEGAGGLMQGAGAGYAGLSEQNLQELEAALGQEGTMAQAGMGAQEYGASDWTSLLESELGSVNQAQNPYSQFGSSMMSMLPMLISSGAVGA